MRVNRLYSILALVGLIHPLFCQQATWHDSSPHRMRFVTVEPGVKLEVLDWGGTGRSVVLLAGYQTAHVFDDFAPKLSAFCHVYGITRRGLGASTVSDGGYDAQHSADDVMHVLDSLRIDKPVLAGHSFGGNDLNVLGAEHPERLAGLIYLNSGEDGTLGARIWSILGIDPSTVDAARRELPPLMRDQPPADYKSFGAYQKWQLRVHGVEFPEAALRALYASNPDGSMGKYLVPKRVKDAIFSGQEKPEYSRVRLPALAFFALPLPLAEQARRYHPQNAEQRAAMKPVYEADSALAKEHEKELQNGIGDIRLVELPGANFYIWLSNEGDLLREIRAFLARIRS